MITSLSHLHKSLRASSSAIERFSESATSIRSNLVAAIDSLDMTDDWKTGQLRLEGQALKLEGDSIEKQNMKMEDTQQQTLDQLQLDLEEISKGVVQQKQEMKRELEGSLSQLKALSMRKREQRTMELNKRIDDIQDSYSIEDNEDVRTQHESEIAAVRSLIKREEKEEDERLQARTSELNNQFSKQSVVLDRELHTTLQSYERDCQVLRDKNRKEYVNQEREWQKRVNSWSGQAHRAALASVPANTPLSAKRLNERRKEKRGDYST